MFFKDLKALTQGSKKKHGREMELNFITGVIFFTSLEGRNQHYPNSWEENSKSPYLFQVVATQIFLIFIPKIGEDSQFDSYFSNGWFNYQPVFVVE